MNQPITVKAHSLIDYGFLAYGVGGPLALGIDGPARALSTGFALAQGTLNALTDQPYSLKRAVPFKLHGRLESVAVPLLAGLAWRTGAMRGTRNTAFLGGFLAALLGVYSLTDWEAVPPPDLSVRVTV